MERDGPEWDRAGKVRVVGGRGCGLPELLLYYVTEKIWNDLGNPGVGSLVAALLFSLPPPVFKNSSTIRLQNSIYCTQPGTHM